MTTSTCCTMTKFEEFLNDPKAEEMYISGVAGTGKTTTLGKIQEKCKVLDAGVVTVAFTHKACDVLRTKLPSNSNVKTLHSFLKIRPTINEHAKNVEYVDGRAQFDDPTQASILFVDEYSMIGKEDYEKIRELQFDDFGNVVMKVVYLGDPNQLQPVKALQAVYPKGNYQIVLDKIYRQAEGNKLTNTLLQLNSFLNGEPVKPLRAHETFVIGQNLVELYKKSNKSKIILAYTNQKVEELNIAIQGYEEPKKSDTVMSSTVKQTYIYLGNIAIEDVDYIMSITGDMIELGSTYKTLETLFDIDCVKYASLEVDGFAVTRAYVFGSSKYMQALDKLKKRAVKANNDIEALSSGMQAKNWAQVNYKHNLAIERRDVWRDYMAFKNNVICLDFPHAMTVHTSQGSTFEEVYLDTENLSICSNYDFSGYLRLMYVGISRASKIVYTN